MASMRRVRRQFREDLLRSVGAGQGNTDDLMRLAGEHFGRSVGYEELIKTFLRSEVQAGLSVLRNDGHVESVGRKWKSVDNLNEEDVDVISTRRLKRVRGELKAEIRLAHEHGRFEDAVAATRMLDLLQSRESETSHKALEEAVA